MTTTIQATLFNDAWPPLTGRDQRGYRISDRVLVSRIDRKPIIGFRLVEDGERLLLDDNCDLIHSAVSWAPLPRTS